jgi:hypothetical protein
MQCSGSMMRSRMISLMQAVTLVLSAAAQDVERRDTVAAYGRKFGFSIGVADPYLYSERLYTSGSIDEVTGLPDERDEVWRNAFAIPRNGIRRAYPLSFIYQPVDRLELGLGFWARGLKGEHPYFTSIWRIQANASYRPAIAFSERIRPVAGICFGYDHRWHDVYGDDQWSPRFTSSTTCISVAAVVGLRVASDRMIAGLDLNVSAFAYIEGTYTQIGYYSDRFGTSGSFSHKVDPSAALNNGYAWGPMTFRLCYTL